MVKMLVPNLLKSRDFSLQGNRLLFASAELIPRFFPAIHAALEGLDIGVSHFHVLDCLTGRSCLIRSMAIEDYWLVPFEFRQLFFKSFKRDGPFEHYITACLFFFVSAHEKGFA